MTDRRDRESGNGDQPSSTPSTTPGRGLRPRARVRRAASEHGYEHAHDPATTASTATMTSSGTTRSTTTTPRRTSRDAATAICARRKTDARPSGCWSSSSPSSSSVARPSRPSASSRRWSPGSAAHRLPRTRPRRGPGHGQRRRDRRGHRHHAARRGRRQDRAPPTSRPRPTTRPCRHPARHLRPAQEGDAAPGRLRHLADPANRVVPRTTIPEGLWTAETFAALSKSRRECRSRTTRRPPRTPRRSACPRRPTATSRAGCSPSTYEFARTRPPPSSSSQMVAQTVEVLEDAGIPATSGSARLTIASIVEGEVNGDADRAKVARVILNRLDDGPPTTACSRWTPPCTSSPRSAARPARPTPSAPRTAPTTPTQRPGPAARPDRQPGRGLDRGGGEPGRGRLALLRHGRPEHRRDEVRRDARAEHDRNVQEFQAWCRRTRASADRAVARG